MEARIKENQAKPAFKPFTLEIDINTLNELKVLWAYLSIDDVVVERYTVDIGKLEHTHEISMIPWVALDEKLKELGLK